MAVAAVLLLLLRAWSGTLVVAVLLWDVQGRTLAAAVLFCREGERWDVGDGGALFSRRKGRTQRGALFL